MRKKSHKTLGETNGCAPETFSGTDRLTHGQTSIFFSLKHTRPFKTDPHIQHTFSQFILFTTTKSSRNHLDIKRNTLIKS